MKSKVGYHLIADELENLRGVAEAKYGSISFEQLKTSVEVIANFLNKHPRVFAVRVDLRVTVHRDGVDSTNSSGNG